MWYVLRTVPEQEQEAVKLMERVLGSRLVSQCRILKKERLLRIRGQYVRSIQDLFPGYVFVETDSPKELSRELSKARAFPAPLGSGAMEMIPVEEKDLAFLKDVCGEKLNCVMGLSTVEADEEGRIREIRGILRTYEERVLKQRFRKRFVIVKIPLFNREQEVLFGIRTEEDRIAGGVEENESQSR